MSAGLQAARQADYRLRADTARALHGINGWAARNAAARFAGAVAAPLGWWAAWAYLAADPHGLVAPGLVAPQGVLGVIENPGGTLQRDCNDLPIHAVGAHLSGPDACTQWLVPAGHKWPFGVPKLQPPPAIQEEDRGFYHCDPQVNQSLYSYRIKPVEHRDFGTAAAANAAYSSARAVHTRRYPVPADMAWPQPAGEREVGPAAGGQLAPPGGVAVELSPEGARRKRVRRKPPKLRRTRERKFFASGHASYRAALLTFGAVTEFGDFVEALWEALPAWAQSRRNASLTTMFGDLYRHWDDIDWPEAMNNLLTSQSEDALTGKVGRLGQRSRSEWWQGPKWQREGFGWTIGPAL